MIKLFLLIVGLFLEIFLLTVILIFFLLGLLGVFLPVVPGVVLVGAGAAIYSLMIKNNFGTITPKVHHQVTNVKGKIFSLPLTQKIMGIINHFKKKRDVQVKIEIVKNGIILFGFNLALVLFFVFSISGLAFLIGLTNSPEAVSAFVPLIAIFIFAALSAVIWYRFGQMLGQKFKTRRVINASLVVLISLLPLLLLLFVLSGLLGVVGGFKQEMLVLTFLSVLLVSILGSIFEVLIVNLGAVTSGK